MTLADRVQGWLLGLFLGLMGLLPIDIASALVGFIGRAIGPSLAISRRALTYKLQRLRAEGVPIDPIEPG